MISQTDETVSNAAIVREAMIGCLEERDGHPYATADGCERLRDILKQRGVAAVVSIGEDGLFQVKVSTLPQEEPVVFLRRLAQSDYVAEGNYFPDGQKLLAVADALEAVGGLVQVNLGALPNESVVEFLRRLAQNDYMVDLNYLPDGWRLLSVANALEATGCKATAS